MSNLEAYLAITRRMDELKAEVEQLGDFIDQNIEVTYRGEIFYLINMIQRPIEDLEFRIINSTAIADPATRGLCVRCGSKEVGGECQGDTARSYRTCGGPLTSPRLPNITVDGYFGFGTDLYQP